MLKVKNISKSFGSVAAVSDISFDVRENEIVALVGPNGAGKTTSFNMIAGAMAPDRGQVLFRGAPIQGLPPERIASLGIARTFQVMRPLAGMTVLENAIVGPLAMGLSMREALSSAREIIEQVDLAGKSNAIASTLTLPERKMLELAKALSLKPSLLLLDEVMASLRPVESDRIVALLKRLRDEGLTILLIEHVMRVVMSTADRVVVMHHGEKIAEGVPADIAANETVIEKYLGRRQKTQ
ncbi:MAG: ABC transporter ATP-binding protein [Hyphomicrobiales bacterium]|nr:ABC transporter ATP-binding protein [Hyphomicrobiales bacterium]